MLPIEVKAGKAGTLKSLHRFVAERGLPLALRVNSARPLVQVVSATTGAGPARFRLLSIPAYLVEQSARLVRDLG